MKYGCIAERLGHSFSREIHEKIGRYEYELREIPKGALDGFMTGHDFLGINVTIPYKRDVIPYLYEIDEPARRMGAVNTIVNRGGRLYGYNTDFPGMREMIVSAGIELGGKKVLVLGTGGTSHMARELSASLGASATVVVSRTGRDGAVTYEDAYRDHTDAEVIINTTPVGMYPEVEGTPVDIGRFPLLSGVVDAVYNPLRTRLVTEAQTRDIRCVGGLYMLVAQAVFAAEKFTGETLGADMIGRIYSELYHEKENIVLTGMPASGKSSIGRRIAADTGRRHIDTDAEIVKRCGMPISEMFSKYGEAWFRDRESEAIADAAKNTGCVISTGGGAILREENIRALKQNGRIYYIDRPLEWLTPKGDRPLARDVDAIRARYNERYDRYISTADVIVHAVDDKSGKNARTIEKEHGLL